MRRVEARHVTTGVSPQLAATKVRTNDRVNAELIRSTKRYADVVVRSISLAPPPDEKKNRAEGQPTLETETTTDENKASASNKKVEAVMAKGVKEVKEVKAEKEKPVESVKAKAAATTAVTSMSTSTVEEVKEEAAEEDKAEPRGSDAATQEESRVESADADGLLQTKPLGKLKPLRKLGKLRTLVLEDFL
eukprot:9049487-Pyramimonas_sp.AAC.1